MVSLREENAFLPLHIVQKAIYGGWAVGPDACFWEVILITASLGMSIVNVFLISAHRYLVIIFEHSISQLQAKIIIAISWLGLLALIGGISHIYSLSNGALSGLQNNFMYCYLALSSNDPVNQVVGSLIIFIISSVIIFIIFAYSSIVIKFSRVNRSLNEDINNSISIDSSPTKKGLKTAQEKNLLKKSIAICASFIFSWIFFDFLAIYEVTMHEEAPSIYHSFIDVVALAFPVVNFYILYHFDSTVKKNIRKLLKLD